MARIIKSNVELRQEYSCLNAGDLVLGQLNLKQCEEYIFLDLLARGIKVVPSPLAQQLSRSKCMQAAIFSKFMVPDTLVIRCRRDMVLASQMYAASEIGRVISKQDRGDCGTGINLWPSVEDLYNAVSLQPDFFPFVIQPFVSEITDVRVVIVGEYIESYWRKNRVSFRHNMHFGGDSGEYVLSSSQVELCKKIMERGMFPFAHIDLLVTPEGTTWFSEISLRGGIKGARISAKEYRERVDSIYDRVVQEFLS